MQQVWLGHPVCPVRLEGLEVRVPREHSGPLAPPEVPVRLVKPDPSAQPVQSGLLEQRDLPETRVHKEAPEPLAVPVPLAPLVQTVPVERLEHLVVPDQWVQPVHLDHLELLDRRDQPDHRVSQVLAVQWARLVRPEVLVFQELLVHLAYQEPQAPLDRPVSKALAAHLVSQVPLVQVERQEPPALSEQPVRGELLERQVRQDLQVA